MDYRPPVCDGSPSCFSCVGESLVFNRQVARNLTRVKLLAQLTPHDNQHTLLEKTTQHLANSRYHQSLPSHTSLWLNTRDSPTLSKLKEPFGWEAGSQERHPFALNQPFYLLAFCWAANWQPASPEITQKALRKKFSWTTTGMWKTLKSPERRQGLFSPSDPAHIFLWFHSHSRPEILNIMINTCRQLRAKHLLICQT